MADEELFALLADRTAADELETMAAQMPAGWSWRNAIEQWLASEAPYMLAIDMPDPENPEERCVHLGNAVDMSDLMGMIEDARTLDRKARLRVHSKCSAATTAAIAELDGIERVTGFERRQLH